MAFHSPQSSHSAMPGVGGGPACDFPHQCFREFETYLSAYLQASRPSTSQQSNARHRLTLLSTVQFQELAEDLLNELRLRRASRDPNERPPPPDDTQGFQHKRIDARMKLSTLPEHRFRDLVCDIYFELIRRFPDSKAMSPSPTASTPLPADDASSSMKELDIMFTNMNVATTAPMGALSPTLNGVPTPPVVAASPATAGLPPSPRSIAPPPGASPSSGMAGAPNAGGPAFDMLPPRVTAHSGHFPSPGGPASGQAPTPLPAAPPADDPFPEPTPGRATRDELPETLIFTADSESDHASQAAPAGTMAHASRQPSVSSHPRASANSANSSFSDLSALQGNTELAQRVNTLNSRLDVARTESRLLVQERDAAIQELAAANLEKSRLAKDMALAQKEHEATTANLRDLLAKAQEQVTQLTERLDNAQLEINNLHMKLRARSLSDTSGIPSGESPSTPMPGAAMHMHQESFSGGALSPRHPPHQHHHHHHHHQQQQQMQAATGGSPDNGQGLSRRASILLQSEHSPSMSLSAITLPGFLQPARSLIAAAEHRDTHEIISHTGAIVFIVSQFIDDCLLICKDSPAMPLEVREFVFIIEKDLQLRLSKLLNTSQSIATGSGPQMAVPEMTPLLVSIGNNTQEMLRAVAPFRPVAMHQASGSFSQSQQQQPPPYPQHQQQFSQSQFSQQQQQQQQQQQPYYSPLPSPHQYHHQQAGPLRSSAPIQPNATHPSLLGAGRTSAPVLSASSAGTAAGAGPRLMGGDPMSPSHFIGGSMSSSSSSGMLTSTSDSPHGGWSPAPGGGGPGSRSGPSPGPGNASAPLSTATIDQATDDGSSGVHRHIAILIDEIIAESRGLAQHLKAYQTKHGELRTEGVPPHALAHSPSLLDLSAQCLAALDCVIRPAQTLRDFAFSHRTTAFRRSLYSAVEKLLTDISEHVAGLGQAQADLRANPGIGAESISSVLVPLLRQINHLKSLLPPGSH